ncbi:hypothetical protein C8J57DRAFT_161989 [Mycena rebaudengoi]|nr:hypothetical protein C8J57DRAFT_161989 [Mycena rebaudengoi]
MSGVTVLDVVEGAFAHKQALRSRPSRTCLASATRAATGTSAPRAPTGTTRASTGSTRPTSRFNGSAVMTKSSRSTTSARISVPSSFCYPLSLSSHSSALLLFSSSPPPRTLLPSPTLLPILRYCSLFLIPSSHRDPAPNNHPAGWFTGAFLAARLRLVHLAGTDRLDRPLMITQMQGQFQVAEWGTCCMRCVACDCSYSRLYLCGSCIRVSEPVSKNSQRQFDGGGKLYTKFFKSYSEHPTASGLCHSFGLCYLHG